MGSLVKSIFGGGSEKPEAPPPPAKLPAPPTTVDTTQGGEWEMKKAASRQGVQKTILTGALTPSSGKKTVLG